jgi:hypothetical protein
MVTERNRTEREVLLDRRETPLTSAEEVMEACLPLLTARLWATCNWVGPMGGTWKVGDFNYLVVSAAPDPETSLYVQFWSEPPGGACVEVCSGHRNAGAVRYVRQPQRRQIEALGYRIGGGAGNFEKEVAIATGEEAETVAREAAGIFFDVFGYRGQWPLAMEWHQGERADHRPTYSSLATSDLSTLAAHLGLEVVKQDEARPTLWLRDGPRIFLATLHRRVTGTTLYDAVLLETLVQTPRRVSDATLQGIAEALAFAQVARQEPRTLALSTAVSLRGGVTLEWIAAALQQWFIDWRTCRRMVRGSTTRVPKARPSRAVRQAVH